MSNRITYTPEEQDAIRALPVYADRTGTRHPKRGLTVQGYVIGDAVGLSVASQRAVVYRGEHPDGSVALVTHSSRPQKVWFANLIPARDIVTFIMWQSMLDRCFGRRTNGYSSYGGRGVVVEHRAWLPAGLPTKGGPSAARAAAFARFKRWARWSFGGTPCLDGAGRSTQVSRPRDEGNYGPWCKVLTEAQHREEAAAAKAEGKVIHMTRRNRPVIVRRARTSDYDGEE
jgi:hypothetical protein